MFPKNAVSTKLRGADVAAAARPGELHTDAIAHRLKSILKIGQSTSNHALQFVALQARVWAADENDEACRPWYLLCLELYPRGKVINHRIHRPASKRPQPVDFLHFILNHIESPPEDEASVRPTHISFVDGAVTSALAPHLTRLKIKCETLTIAEGVTDYIKKFSNKMIERGRATRSETAERPGLLSVAGVTPSAVASLMKAVKDMHKAAPWSRIPEHVALQVRMPMEMLANGFQGGSSSQSQSHSPDPGPGKTAGSSAMQHKRKKASRYRDKFYVTVLGSDEKVLGFAVVASLAMMRDKYRRVMGTRTGNGLPDLDVVKPMASDVYVCAACGRRVGEDGPERWVYRCSACRRLLYCDEDCQRDDWRRRHRDECKPVQQDKDYVFSRPEWAWLDREIAFLFLDPTAVPFDDLDGFERHGWPFVDQSSPPLYPLPLVSVQGSDGISSRRALPTPKEISTLMLIAQALAECLTTPPSDGILHLSNGVSISLAENLAESIPVPSEREEDKDEEKEWD